MTNIQLVDMDKLDKDFTAAIRAEYPQQLDEDEFYKAGWPIGIIRGKRGVIITNDEAVHYVQTFDEKVSVDFYKSGPNFFCIMPEFTGNYVVNELPVTGEIPVEKFVERLTKSRIADNYKLLKESIRRLDK